MPASAVRTARSVPDVWAAFSLLSHLTRPEWSASIECHPAIQMMRRPVYRCPLRRVWLARAGRGEREDLGDAERTRQEIRVAREMRLEQIDAPAMKRHHGRVRRLEAVLDVHLEDAVLGGRLPAVGAEEVVPSTLSV